jgi:hypothetical protein
MHRTIHILFLLLLGIIVPSAHIHSQETTPEPPNQEIQSIFSEDTCAPPCWFDITPGESTSADVAELLARICPIPIVGHEFEQGTLDPETGYVIDGEYQFNFCYREDGRDNYDYMRYIPSSSIPIHNGKIDSIRLFMHQYYTAPEALTAFGQPDQVRFHWGYGYIIIDFIYLELRLRVISEFVGWLDEERDCNVAKIEEYFVIHELTYFSPEAAIAPGHTTRQDIETPQPALIVYQKVDRYVPPEVWEAWINDEVDMDCIDAWRGLSTEMILPEIPSATQTPNQ